MIAGLGLPWRTGGLVMLANGTRPLRHLCGHHHLGWQATEHLVEAADTDPLVGMALLYGHDLHMQVVEGGSVVIEPFP